MSIRISAPGKVLLLGEYAVLKGAPAVVAAIDCRVQVHIEPGHRNVRLYLPHAGVFALKLDRHGHCFEPSKKLFSIGIANQTKAICAVIEAFQKEFLSIVNPLPAMSLRVDAQPFFSVNGDKFGLGSSAAITVAMLEAMNNFVLNRQVSQDKLFEQAFRVHRTIQEGVGSGVDVAASVFGGIITYRMADSPGESGSIHAGTTLPPSIFVKPVWTKKPVSTRHFLMRWEQYGQQAPHGYSSIIDQLSDIAVSGANAIENRCAGEFLVAVNMYYEALIAATEKTNLPFVSPTHKRLAKIVHRGGGVYKPSGAGGGDLGVIFTSTSANMVQIQEELSSIGFDDFELYFGAKGVQQH